MPFPNEHAARIEEPGKFKDFRREPDKFGAGISAIFGIPEDGGARLQAIRFAKDKFTPDQARAWLKDHEKTAILFEPASEKNDAADRVVRFDVSNIPKTIKTPEGFLRTDSVVTRTGVFFYRNADGSPRRELRDHKQVFDSLSIDSMKMIPLTLNHPNTPSKLLDARNAKEFQVGFTGENVRPDGENIRVPVTVTDADAVSEIEKGKRGLSLGYDCDLIEEPGEYEGQRFDARQENIRYNHLAVVDIPRAGANAQIKLDCDDAFYIENSPEPTNERTAKMPLPKHKIDGIEYEASQEIINFIARETARADAAETALKTAKPELDKATAERDTFKARVDALESEKAKIPDLVAAAVATRLDLERKASVVLDGEDVSKVVDRDVKIKIITKIFPEAKLDAVSDDYLNARVDSAIDTLDVQKRAEALGKQRQDSAPVPKEGDQGNRGDGMEPDPEKAEGAYKKRICDAWKNDGCGTKKDGKQIAVFGAKSKDE